MTIDLMHFYNRFDAGQKKLLYFNGVPPVFFFSSVVQIGDRLFSFQTSLHFIFISHTMKIIKNLVTAEELRNWKLCTNVPITVCFRFFHENFIHIFDAYLMSLKPDHIRKWEIILVDTHNKIKLFFMFVYYTQILYWKC